MRRLLAIALFLVAFSLPALEFPGRGDYLTLKVAVMGPGTELYFWWGHIALVVDDALTGESRFFDYGIFSFETEHFFSNFALGRLIYSCGVSPTELSYRAYRMTNRDITVYTLDLPPETRLEILRFAENNVRPENKNYQYHHFKDNCSTRIRDIIDLAVGGQFKARFGEMPGRFTLRQQVRRHTWFSPFFDWLLNFLMGQDIDVPITVWQEMFLPSEVGSRMLDFAWADSGGIERKLVSSVETVNRAADRPQVLDAPGRQWPGELGAGLLLALAALGVSLLGRRRPGAARVFLGLFQSALGLFFGGVGTVLFFMTFFTNHDYTWHNSNVIFVNPLILAAVPLGILLALRKGGGPFSDDRRSPAWILGALWTLVFFGGLASLALRALPWFHQQNQATLVLVLPLALVLSRVPRWFVGKSRGA